MVVYFFQSFYKNFSFSVSICWFNFCFTCFEFESNDGKLAIKTKLENKQTKFQIQINIFSSYIFQLKN